AGRCTLREALRLGRPCVTFAIADNQLANVTAVGEAGAAIVSSTEGAAAAACALADDPERRATLSRNGAALIDGHGADRVAAVVVELLGARQVEAAPGGARRSRAGVEAAPGGARRSRAGVEAPS